ncbi:MAG: hypothetical protein J0H34_14015 [Rhizobiales bacterium]|nr:hypothetical protein [Hyphomicrobiales bacterium]
MGRRNFLYALLLAWTFAVGFIDRAGLLSGGLSSMFDIAHLAILVVLTWLWCNADADAGGHKRVAGLIGWAMVLLTPVGLGIYLFRSRTPGLATLLLIGYFAGFAAAYLAGWYAAALLAFPSVGVGSAAT